MSRENVSRVVGVVTHSRILLQQFNTGVYRVYTVLSDVWRQSYELIVDTRDSRRCLGSGSAHARSMKMIKAAQERQQRQYNSSVVGGDVELLRVGETFIEYEVGKILLDT
eukprot:GHVQ01020221.1.p1 GENE.GHVQ01020221.1~~GHVQ01020221.1.p1  ORF type:complete len:110 (+),score=8.01 GHVQ01020221.1:163-492(+)